MQKQLRIITRHRLAICPFSSSLFQPLPHVASIYLSKHLGRRSVYFRYNGSRVFSIGTTSWYIHCSSTGRRWLSALPF
jgi:hypothetical protein